MELRKIHTTSDLKKAIEELELRKSNEEELVKVHFREVLEKYKPANLIKETVAEVSDSMDFKKNLGNIALGIGVGYLSKKLFVGKKTSGIAQKIIGTAIDMGAADFIAQKGKDMFDAAKSKGFFQKIFSRRS
jgi:hypothetical protein